MAVLYYCFLAIDSGQMVLGQTEFKLEKRVDPGPQGKEPRGIRRIHEGCKAYAPVI